MTTLLSVNSNFDGGNIICHAANDPNNIQLSIARDNYSEYFQWFYFRVSGLAGVERVMHINNAGESSYAPGWEDYRCCVSYDRQTWGRIPTSYQDGVLSIRHKPICDSAYYAYFAPYSMERHADLIAKTQCHDLVKLNMLGTTLDGQSMDMLNIGEERDDRLRFWVIARQHPGETMAEWWMEGFLERLLKQNDTAVKTLLEKVVFHIVPNMNPDGSKRGHLRTNAAGMNLNREWDKASLEKSPEVFHVRQAMHDRGVHFSLDVHGDENLPYVFIAGSEGVPRFSDKEAKWLETYLDALKKANSDFQTEKGYPKNAPGSANMGMCTSYVAETFGCLAMTLEMPFKDNANASDLKYGWSPERCRQLGADSIDAMLEVVRQSCHL